MAFKAVIHYPANQDKIREVHKAVAQFRADKTVKYLGAMGVTYDTLKDILQQKELHNTVSKAV